MIANDPRADRLLAMPPYIFSELNVLKAEAQKKGMSLLSLAIGDPDRPTPDAIVEKFKEAASRPSNHLYSPYEGSLQFRTAVSEWLKKRFDVSMNPEKEILTLIGSKEGIAHFPLAVCNPGDRILYPSPGYPIFQTCGLLAGAVAIPLPHSSENGFLPNPAEIEAMMKEHRPKMMIVNYPSNPTTAVVSRELLTEIVRLAKKYEVIIAYDNAYAEMYFEDSSKPLSIMEIEGAKDVAIEFQSLSKTFNMTGWRLGYAFGNEKLIKALTQTKTNIDSGPLLSVQETGAFALSKADEFAAPIRKVYQERRAVLLKALDELGIEYFRPNATFFVWARVPNGQPSMEFAKELIEKQGLVVTPGIGFGAEGEGFFRFALTVDVEKTHEAVARLKAYLGSRA